MGNFFSKKKAGSKKSKEAAAKVTEADRAMLELKVVRDKILQHKKRVSAVMEAETEAAKRLLKEGRRDRALIAVKKKRVQAKLLEDADSKIMQIQTVLDGIETAQQNAMLLDAMKYGKSVLEKLQKEISIEEVQNLMLDTQEALDKQRGIESAMSGAFDAVDEAAMDQELEDIANALNARAAAAHPADQQIQQTIASPIQQPTVVQEPQPDPSTLSASRLASLLPSPPAHAVAPSTAAEHGQSPAGRDPSTVQATRLAPQPPSVAQPATVLRQRAPPAWAETLPMPPPPGAPPPGDAGTISSTRLAALLPSPPVHAVVAAAYAGAEGEEDEEPMPPPPMEPAPA